MHVSAETRSIGSAFGTGMEKEEGGLCTDVCA